MSTEAKNRKAVNKALAALPTYTDGLPLQAIDNILTSNGFNALESGIYCGRDGHLNEQVGPKSWLSLTWHKMDVSGRYEIVAYVS